MASCLINITGGTGKVSINYVYNGNSNDIIAETGDEVYIPDTAEDVTYTLLEDATGITVSSSCVTIEELPIKYYEVSWDVFECFSPFKFTELILGNVSEELNVDYNIPSGGALSASINNLNNPNIKVIGLVDSFEFFESNNLFIATPKILIKVKGEDIPQIKATSELTGSEFYLIGKLVTSIPNDIVLLGCNELPIIQTTTTTTSSTSSSTTTTTTNIEV